MKIALAQLDYHVGNFEENTRKIIVAIEEAKSKGADIAVFSELAICGYPPRDFLEFQNFIEMCIAGIEEIAAHCKGIAAIVGGPSRNPSSKGKDLFNSAYFLKDGRISDIIHKTLLPTYDVFDEYRYFEPNGSFHCINLDGCKIALTICEDLWNIDDNPLYIQNPMDILIKEKPDFAINIAASPFSFNHDAKRTSVLTKNAKMYGIPFFYVNHIGAQTEIIFDGGSTVVSPKGSISKMPYFVEDLQVFDLEDMKVEEKSSGYILTSKYEQIYMALVEGIGDYFRKLGFKKAILGMSGGVDSALVLALAVKALGNENVLPVLMPSPYSSTHSVDDSLDMIRRLKTDHKIIPIEKIMDAYEATLEPHFKGWKKDVTEENIQARARGAILM
ncbi:MAG: NAD(+) synthase, partial [Bacteroidota bacterium]|nr:NAD(+) synthase [Bacteroidota bacterium]